MNSLKNTYLESLQNDFELSNTLTKNSSIIKDIDKNPQGDTIISEIQRIKSSESIIQINRLQKTLTEIEINCSSKVAEKYLNGYLENRGVTSFKDFIANLK